MDILIVGIAGPVFAWVRAGIVAACGLPVVAPGNPALLESAPEAPPARLCAVHHLPLELAQKVRKGGLRVISTFDPPASGCNLRQAAAALYAQSDLLGAPGVMQADRDSDPAALLAHCGLAGGFAAALAPAGATESLLDAASGYARRGERATQIWPRSLLFDGDHPDQPLPRVIELTGPARNLAYGPYIGFSPGPARLSVVLAVAPSCRHAEMAIELHGSQPLGRGLFLLAEPGVFAAEIDVVVPSAREELEIRLKSERGAIDGAIGVDQARLVPLG